MQEAAQIEKVLFTRFFGGQNSQSPVLLVAELATLEQTHRDFMGKADFQSTCPVPMAENSDFDHGGGPKTRFPSFLTQDCPGQC